ncbi:hypothetical protein D030_3396B, partial [Vibrio parahaemolyticus AQ3810]
HRLR